MLRLMQRPPGRTAAVQEFGDFLQQNQVIDIAGVREETPQTHGFAADADITFDDVIRLRSRGSR